MKIETTLGAVVLIGGVAFLVGAQIGYYKTKQNIFDKAANDFAKQMFDNMK